MNHIEEYLQSRGVASDEAEMAAYGIRKMYLFIINVVVFIIIGLILGCAIEMCFFLIAYIPLRVYAGGFHLSRLIYCEILSLILVCIVALIMNHFSGTDPGWFMTLIAGVAIPFHLILAPQDNINKRLNPHEKKKYRCISVVLVVTYYLTEIVLYVFGVYCIQIPVIMALMVSSLSIMENHMYERTR